MKIFSAENFYVRFFIQYSLPLIVIGIMSRTFPLTGPLYYIVPFLLTINILLAFILIPLKGKSLSYFLIIFIFPAYCLITSAWSLYPIISLQRSLYLLLMYAGILSSVLLYKKFFPEKGIGFLIPANIMILILSAVSLIFGIPDDRWTGGNGLGFMGFAGHQNILAAAILFTFPGMIALGIAQRAKPRISRLSSYFSPLSSLVSRLSSYCSPLSSLVFRLSSYFSRLSFFILLLTANCLLITLTYSRAAILALVIGTITYLIITKSKKKILAILFSISAVMIVLYFTVSPLQSSIDSLLNKDGGKILGRRMILWEPSLEAAKLGGVFGLGYGVSAPDIKTPILTGSHFEDGRYIREKGNSVLAMIEETGLIGLLLFLLPLFWFIRKFIIYNSQFTIKEIPKNNYTLYILHCTLFSMLIHSQFEAWWVGVGSVALPLFLIFLFMALLLEKSEELRIKN